MRRGDIYLAEQAAAGRTRGQLFVVLSRQLALDSGLSTVICAPVFAGYDGLATQVPVGAADGLPYEGSIQGDVLVSMPRTALTRLVVSLGSAKMKAMEGALRVALGLSGDE